MGGRGKSSIPFNGRRIFTDNLRGRPSSGARLRLNKKDAKISIVLCHSLKNCDICFSN